ncbi:MarR family winged helix-turn-helix transcriptional regulator [Alkalibacterium sp. AK22]|uniref:MarR family winged helix-turn-helix transcriptional regulator n=1 Tax=Alkalibacterium sp. AK22 TaxID=1229520 RepID=UPI0004B9EEFF|nr:MarR family transcriptional regulator [Alkalibacterium sp. AK22]
MPEKTDVLLEKVSDLNILYKHVTGMMLQEHGLSHSAINLMKLIGSNEYTLKQITEHSKLDKSTVSRQMNALVKKGLVTKTTGRDKRYAYFTVTDEAQQIYKEFHAHMEDKFETILSGWTQEEVHMLTVLLGRLNRSMTNRI